MKLIIPGKPPTENHMWHYVKRRTGELHKILKPEARAWFEETRLRARNQAKKQGWEMPPKKVWIKLQMRFFFPNHNHPDPTNCLKVFLDALEGVIYENDKWVLVDLLKPGFDRYTPRTEIEVREVE